MLDSSIGCQECEAEHCISWNQVVVRTKHVCIQIQAAELGKAAFSLKHAAFEQVCRPSDMHCLYATLLTKLIGSKAHDRASFDKQEMQHACQDRYVHMLSAALEVL